MSTCITKRLKLSFPKSNTEVENGFSEASDDYPFMKKSHASTILSQLHRLQEATEHCDAVFEINDMKIAAHRNVLATCSPSLKCMFNDLDDKSNSAVMQIEGVEVETLNLLINYAYTGTIKITELNCRSLISASHMLQMLAVRNAACELLMKHIDCDNCCEICVFAEAYDCVDLLTKAFDVVAKNFSNACKQIDFVNLSTSKLIELLDRDDIEIETEADVFYAVQRWYEHSPEDRHDDLFSVLQAVRLPLLELNYLEICTNSFASLKTNPNCVELIDEAKSYHSSPDKYCQIFNKRTKPRNCFDTMQIIITVDGETMKGFCPVSRRWYYINELPVTKKTGAIVSLNNNLYVTSKVFVKSTPVNRMWRYDPFSNTWENVASMIISRTNFGLAAVGGNIYAIGGRDNERKCLDLMEQYNPETNNWTSISKLKTHASSFALTAHNGMLYVAGGVISKEGGVITKSFLRYDPKKSSWIDLAPMSTHKFGAAICVLNEYIYVIGGCTSLTRTSSRVERYDVKNDCWTNISSMNERRFEPGISVMYDKIYVLGGRSQTDNNKYHDTIECYDPETNKWEVVGKLPPSSLWLSCVPLKIKKCFCQEVVSN